MPKRNDMMVQNIPNAIFIAKILHLGCCKKRIDCALYLGLCLSEYAKVYTSICSMFYKVSPIAEIVVFAMFKHKKSLGLEQG